MLKLLSAFGLGKERKSRKKSSRIMHRMKSIAGKSLRIENLESRQLLSITWDGGGSSNLWSDRFNWVGDQVPGANAELIFQGTLRTNTQNDLTTSFNSITFASSGFTIGGSTPVTVTSGITVNSGVLNSSIPANITLGGTISVNVPSSTGLSISGGISGTSGLTKVGGGTLTLLTSSNYYTGATTINSGTLSLGTTGSLSSSSNLVLANSAGTYFAPGHNTKIGNLTGGGSLGGEIQLGSSSLAIASGNFSGVISGTGSISKGTTDVLTLSGNNTYSGTTTINAGTLSVGHAHALGNNSNIIISMGGTLSIGSYSPSVGSVSLQNGTISVTSGTLSSTGFSCQTGTISANLSGILTKSGTGTLNLQGSISSPSLGISGGTVLLSGANTFLPATMLTITGGTLDLGAKTHTLSSAVIPNFYLNGGTISNGSINLTNVMYSYNIQTGTGTTNTISANLTGAGGLIKTGTGQLNLTGVNTYSRPAVINAGTLQLGNGTSLNGSITGNVTIAANAKLKFAPGAVDQIFGGDISGEGSVWVNSLPHKTLTLNGNLTYTGGTTLADNLDSADLIIPGVHIISTLAELQAIDDADGHYLLVKNINASDTANWRDPGADGILNTPDDLLGFRPLEFGVGGYDPFTGIFDGGMHTISNLYSQGLPQIVQIPGVGLFEQLYTATVRDLGFVNPTIIGYENVGALAAYSHSSAITNCYLNGGTISSPNSETYSPHSGSVGGLIGNAYNSAYGYIQNCRVIGTIDINGIFIVGGLIGSLSHTNLIDSYVNVSASSRITSFAVDAATSNRQQPGSVGGLVGAMGEATVENCYANVAVRAVADPVEDPYDPNRNDKTAAAGGLVGAMGSFGSIVNSHATGKVNEPGTVGTLTIRGTNAGGLVGAMGGSGIEDSYATGEVWGYQVGGILGAASGNDMASIDHCYATGAVHAAEDPDGWVYGYYDEDYSTGIKYFRFNGDAHCNAGGLVGVAHRLGIANSKATGQVSAYGPYATAGGFIGSGNDHVMWINPDVEILESYATGEVAAGGFHAKAGGFAGELITAAVGECYATGDVSVRGGSGHIGYDGLHDSAYFGVGFGEDPAYNYATDMANPSVAGGFAGNVTYGTVVYNCYATGDVSLVYVAGDFDYYPLEAPFVGYGGGFVGYGGAVGGLLEAFSWDAWIYNSFATGSGGGAGIWGPFAGHIKAPDLYYGSVVTLVNDYYLSESNYDDGLTGTLPATAAQLSNTNFVLYTTSYSIPMEPYLIPVWDFDSTEPIWEMGPGGLPLLVNTTF